MYLFISYAFQGMRGVVARGIRVADFFDSVEFWHDGEDDWLRESKHPYKILDFRKLVKPKNIVFPPDIEGVVFCDIPSNLCFQNSVMMAAKKQGVPVIILENIYRKGQLEEVAYRNMLEIADGMILNGIDLFESELKPKSYLVPPLLNTEAITEETLATTRETFGIPENTKVVLAAAYNQKVIDIVNKLNDDLKAEQDYIIILSGGGIKEIHREDNIIYAPFMSQEEYSSLLYMSELILAKAGFLQILEAFMLRKPVICIGDVKGFHDDWVDPQVMDAFSYYPQWEEKLFEEFKQLMDRNSNFRKESLEKIYKLHHRTKSNAARETADIIKKITAAPAQVPQDVIISLDLVDEMEKVKEFVHDRNFILPIVISVPYLLEGIYHPVPKQSTAEIFESTEILRTGFILKWDYREQYDFHGGITVLPWYEYLLESLDIYFNKAKNIYVSGQKSYTYFEDILEGFEDKVTIV